MWSAAPSATLSPTSTMPRRRRAAGLAFRISERGPETFVPKVPGLIRPNDVMPRTEQAVNVTVSVPINAQGADSAALARVDGAVDRLTQSLPGEVTRIVAKEVHSGGPLAKTVGRRR